MPLRLLLLSALGLMLRFSDFAVHAAQQVLSALAGATGPGLPAAISRMLDGLASSRSS